jgi:hypothetical protein
LVNVVCDGALLTGYGRGLLTIDGAVIREVARDLKLCDDSGRFTGSDDADPAAEPARGWRRFRRGRRR